MTTDKHSQDAVAKLYAEWISAGVKLSVAGFAASTKIMEAATQSVIASRAKAKAAEAALSASAPVPNEAPAAKATLKVVPKAAKPKASSIGHGDVPIAAEADKTVAAAKPATAADDLKQISGIGPKLEQMLARKGFTTFAQVASITSDDLAKLDAELNLNGRIQRDDWVGQAARLGGAS